MPKNSGPENLLRTSSLILLSKPNRCLNACKESILAIFSWMLASSKKFCFNMSKYCFISSITCLVKSALAWTMKFLFSRQALWTTWNEQQVKVIWGNLGDTNTRKMQLVSLLHFSLLVDWAGYSPFYTVELNRQGK